MDKDILKRLFIFLDKNPKILKEVEKRYFQKKTKLDRELAENRFNEFYSEYPKKVGKAIVLKKYKQGLYKKHDEIMAGLEKWNAKWKADKTEKQYIPHASTWINQKRWEDEVEVEKESDIKSNIKSIRDLDL